MSKPNWIVYKNDHAISQGATWHKALSHLIIMEGLTTFKVIKFIYLVSVFDMITEQTYKIVNERN